MNSDILFFFGAHMDALPMYEKLENAETAKPKDSMPENAGKPWTRADEEILCRMFDTGCPGEAICNHFQRSHESIAALH